MTQYILESNIIGEYQEIAELAKTFREELWGAVVNPVLTVKNTPERKITTEQVLQLYQETISQLSKVISGALVVDLYVDPKISADALIQQARAIAPLHEHVVISLPTTLEGFKARTVLRKDNIAINNAYVYSQEQLFAVYLHEALMHMNNQDIHTASMVSLGVGKLDEIGENGLDLLSYSHNLKQQLNSAIFTLQTDTHSLSHIAKGVQGGIDFISAPAPIYRQWLSLSYEQKENAVSERTNLSTITPWQIPLELLQIRSTQEFEQAIYKNKLDIRHDLTDKTIYKLEQDWQGVFNQ